MRLVLTAHHHPGIDQLLQPVGEDGPSDVEIATEVVEPSNTTERISHDEDGPSITDDLECPSDGTVEFIVVGNVRGTLGGDGIGNGMWNDLVDVLVDVRHRKGL